MPLGNGSGSVTSMAAPSSRPLSSALISSSVTLSAAVEPLILRDLPDLMRLPRPTFKNTASWGNSAVTHEYPVACHSSKHEALTQLVRIEEPPRPLSAR